MKLYEILIPIRANDGKTYPVSLCKDFLSRIGASVGGYTLPNAVNGYWRDAAGKEYFETMQPVRVACEPEAMAAITADALATFGDQKCIMFYVLSGDVTFTTREEANEAAALAHVAENEF